MKDDRYPWMLIGLLWMASFLNAADRSILTAIMPTLREEFHISDIQLGLVNSVFFWVYAVSAFLFGRVGDSVRWRNVIIYGLAFWSVATGLMPLASGFAVLLAMRTLVAVGESTYYPTATALISGWHKPTMRSRALSIHQTAVFVGSGLGGWVAGLLGQTYGWKAPFLIFAALGLVVVVIFTRTLRDAPGEEERVRTVKTVEPLGVIFKSPAALVLCAVFFLATGASSAVLVWSNTFAHDVLKLDLADSALVGPVMINIAGLSSVLAGGYLADRFAQKSPTGRFTVLTIGLSLAAAFLMIFPLATSAVAVGLLLFCTSFGKGLFDGCIYAAMHDVVPPEARATAVGLMTMLGFIGAGISSVVLPIASERLGGMAAGFALLAVLYMLAVVLLLASRGLARRAVLANV